MANVRRILGAVQWAVRNVGATLIDNFTAGADTPGGWMPPVQPARSPARARRDRLDLFDVLLICLFLIGIYTNYTIQVSAKVPFPSAPSGIAGLFLLWRRRDRITPAAFGGLLGVLALYLVSIFCATNLDYLSRRTTGLIQLTYSLVIGYALFLTVTQGTRRQIAAIFLSFVLVILIGCFLEDYAGLRPISDAVRSMLYSRGIYENDLRDVLLYRRIRPKFFASEPASVTFCYSLFSFIWLVVSQWRLKLLVFFALIGAGLFAMPGPTLLLTLLLILPYLMFLTGRRNGRLDFTHVFKVGIAAIFFLAAFAWLSQSLFSERIRRVQQGDDPSFFYRVQGPAIAGVELTKDYPFAGAGLTGEPFIEDKVVNIYLRSPAYSEGWQVVKPASELLINYFWLHWIYLGVVFGTIILAAISLWLRTLGVPSAAFCWVVWAILGQASGAYVGPLCWAVMFLSAAASVLYQRTLLEQREARAAYDVPSVPTLAARLAFPRQ